MSELKIFRSAKAKPGTTTELHKYRNTMRPPGNVPYVVDNLREWKRPKNILAEDFRYMQVRKKVLPKNLAKRMEQLTK